MRIGLQPPVQGAWTRGIRGPESRLPGLGRLSVWAAIAAVVVVLARTIAYALTPSQGVLLEELARQEGGPHLAGALAAAVAIGGGVALAVLWLAALAVRERLALEERTLVTRPELRIWRLGARAVVLFLVVSFAFAMVESYIHWRAGLGWHGLHCLVGPVHRDAIPILFALTLVAVAAHGALEHLLAWVRRLVARLAARVHAVTPKALAGASFPRLRSRLAGASALPRGPPDRAVPVQTL